ncbi:hypothetical protein F66182_2983 [Fusarium sp. NRRL 66182]|nr:hypothetical protein F66182_2983 [Fusarium sp. NRRL 66182]
MSAKYAFTKSLREVRFLFCQTSEQSAAVRSFLTRAYPTMKRNNPNTPILIREAAGTQPKVYARYGSSPHAAQLFGHAGYLRVDQKPAQDRITNVAYTERGTEKSQILEGLSDKEIEDAVSGLVQPTQ